MGLQIIGPNGGEPVIFQLAHAYEQATDWHKRRPQLPARLLVAQASSLRSLVLARTNPHRLEACATETPIQLEGDGFADMEIAAEFPDATPRPPC